MTQVKTIPSIEELGFTSETVDVIREVLRGGIANYQGNPVKRENKLNESLAIGFNEPNYDTLSAKIEKNDTRNGKSPLALANDGLCPICGSDHVEYDARSFDGAQRSFCDSCSAIWIESTDGSDWEDANTVESVLIARFPPAMSTRERIEWAKKYANIDGVDVDDNISKRQIENIGVHWHRDVAGFENALQNWYVKSDESKYKPLAYWHSNRPLTPNLFESLKYESHVDVLLMGERLVMHRLFFTTFGEGEWQISVDAELDADHLVDFLPPGTGKLRDDLLVRLVRKIISHFPVMKAQDDICIELLADELKDEAGVLAQILGAYVPSVYMTPKSPEYKELARFLKFALKNMERDIVGL